MTEARQPAAGTASAPESGMAAKFIYRLQVLMRNARAGVKDDETAAQTSRSARSILECLLENGKTARFDVINDHVLFQDVDLSTDAGARAAFEYFAQRTRASGIRAIIVDDSAQAGDILDFAEALTQIEESCKDPFQEMKRLLKFKGIDGIRIVERKEGLDQFYERNALLLSVRDRAHRTYLSALHVVGQAVKHGIAGREVNARNVKRVVESVVSSILADEKYTLALTRMGNYEEPLCHHSVNVCVFSIALAGRLGLPRPVLGEIGVAALLHDVGKRCVAPKILSKLEDVTEYDWQEIRQHPDSGVQILSQLKRPDKAMLGAMVVAFCHHMNIDRTGYPQPDRGIRPNLPSRIVRIADIYDNLTSARSDEMKPFSRDEALAIIREKSGTQLDPVLCAVLASLADVLPATPYLPKSLQAAASSTSRPAPK